MILPHPQCTMGSFPPIVCLYLYHSISRSSMLLYIHRYKWLEGLWDHLSLTCARMTWPWKARRRHQSNQAILTEMQFLETNTNPVQQNTCNQSGRIFGISQPCDPWFKYSVLKARFFEFPWFQVSFVDSNACLSQVSLHWHRDQLDRKKQAGEQHVFVTYWNWNCISCELWLTNEITPLAEPLVLRRWTTSRGDRMGTTLADTCWTMAKCLLHQWIKIKQWTNQTERKTWTALIQVKFKSLNLPENRIRKTCLLLRPVQLYLDSGGTHQNWYLTYNSQYI